MFWDNYYVLRENSHIVVNRKCQRRYVFKLVFKKRIWMYQLRKFSFLRETGNNSLNYFLKWRNKFWLELCIKNTLHQIRKKQQQDVTIKHYDWRKQMDYGWPSWFRHFSIRPDDGYIVVKIYIGLLVIKVALLWIAFISLKTNMHDLLIIKIGLQN